MYRILIGFFLVVAFFGQVEAQEREVTISGREVVERLTRIEEGQGSLEQKIDNVQATLGQRIDNVQATVEQRINEVQATLGQRIDNVQATLGQRIDNVQATLGQRIDNVQATVEQRINEVQATLGQQIDDTNRRIDELRQFLFWGFGVTIAGMFALIGFVIWDRRSALAPAIRRIEELQEREERVEAALREYAAKSPELAESLKKMGLM